VKKREIEKRKGSKITSPGAEKKKKFELISCT
jgi:hypothetical protein